MVFTVSFMCQQLISEHFVKFDSVNDVLNLE